MYEKDINTFYKILPLFIDTIIKQGKGFALQQQAIEHLTLTQQAYDNQIKKYGITDENPEVLKKVVQTLISYGIALNDTTSNESVFAYAFKSPEVISFILENGYDVSKKLIVHGQEKTTLDMYIRTIMNRINGKFVLFDQEIIVSDTLAFLKELEMIDKLEKSGAKLSNGFENPYEFLICEIVSNNKLAEAEILLELKNDLINSKNLEDENLFMVAQKGNYTQMLELLNVFK